MSNHIVLLTLFGLFIIGCASNEHNEEEKDLTLKIKSDKEAYPEWETVKITFELTNNTNQPIKLITNTGFKVCLGQSNNRVKWWISPPGKSGKFIPSWQILNPGETYNMFIDVKDNYSPDNTMVIVKPPYIFKDGNVIVPGNNTENALRLLSQGDYDIYGEYEFDKNDVESLGVTIDKADESSIWFGEVTSNTIKITIKPKQ